MLRVFLMASSRKGGLPQRSKSTLPPRRAKIQACRLLDTGSSRVYKSPEATLVSGVRNLSLGDKNAKILVPKNSGKNKLSRPRAFSSNAGKITTFKSSHDVAKFIKLGQAQRIVVCAGAGISTGSGIPDFRTAGTGLYDNLQQYNIPYPEAIFDIDYFHQNPKPFFELAKELYPSGKYRPNYNHYFLRLLHDKGQLHRIYTQNIDGLERLAGIPPQKLVEAHGTFSSAMCTLCYQKYEGEEIKGAIFASRIPKCKTKGCPGVIKPDIVFFGEDLPRRFYLYLKDMLLADLVIVMGTSLEVQPFAGIIDVVRYNVPRILFNMKAVGPFRRRTRAHDFVVSGDLTESVQSFVSQLEWQDEMTELISACEDHKKCWVQGEAKIKPSCNAAEDLSGKGANSKPSPPKGGNNGALGPFNNTSDMKPPKRHVHTLSSAKSEGHMSKAYLRKRQVTTKGKFEVLPRLGGVGRAPAYQLWRGRSRQEESSSETSSSEEDTTETSSEEESR